MTTSRTKAKNQSDKARAVLEHKLVVEMAHLMSDIAIEMSDLTKEYGISLVHHNVLGILRGAGSDGLPSGVIAERLITKEPDITRLLDRMEKQSLVVRSRDQVDRRVVMTRITDRGLEVLEKLDHPLIALHCTQFGHIPTEKLEALLGLLQEIRDRPT